MAENEIRGSMAVVKSCLRNSTSLRITLHLTQAVLGDLSPGVFLMLIKPCPLIIRQIRSLYNKI